MIQLTPRTLRQTREAVVALNLSPRDDVAQVNSKYRRLALNLHPDKRADGDATAFRAVDAARSHLLALTDTTGLPLAAVLAQVWTAYGQRPVPAPGPGIPAGYRPGQYARAATGGFAGAAAQGRAPAPGGTRPAGRGPSEPVHHAAVEAWLAVHGWLGDLNGDMLQAADHLRQLPTQARELDLSPWALPDLPDLGDFTSLRLLAVRGLDAQAAHALQLPPRLWTLRLDSCHLTTLPDTILGQGDLQALSLEDNRLHHLPSLASLTSLRALNLAGNRLPCFPSAELAGCQALTDVFMPRVFGQVVEDVYLGGSGFGHGQRWTYEEPGWYRRQA